MTVKRIHYIDIYKGIGIIAMLIGHIDSLSVGVIGKLIHGWHMPLFFFVSGYMFTYKSEVKISVYVKRKAKALLLPYLYAAIFHFFVWLLKYKPNCESIQKTILNIFWNNYSNGLPISNAIWFLTAMFFAGVLFFLFFYLRIEKAIFPFAFVISVICSNRIIGLPWGLIQSAIAIGIMYLGYLFKDHEYIVEEQPLGIPIVAFLLGNFFVIINNDVNMRTNHYGKPLLFWGAVLLICSAMLFFVKKWDNEPHSVFERCLLDGLAFVGRNSLIWLCLNQISIFFVKMVLKVGGGTTNTFGGGIVCLVLTVCVLTILTKLIKCYARIIKKLGGYEH